MSDQSKAAAIEQLVPVVEDAGLSLTHIAMGFVASHPAATSAIIGPRTLEQLDDLFAAADVSLSDDVLDMIDEIVPPGTTVGVSEVAYVPQSLLQADQRRRPAPVRTSA